MADFMTVSAFFSPYITETFFASYWVANVFRVTWVHSCTKNSRHIDTFYIFINA